MFGKVGIFCKVVKKVGSILVRMFCVGDEVCDIEVVKEVGCVVVVVDWGFVICYILVEY